MVNSINILMILTVFLTLALFWLRRAVIPHPLTITPAFSLMQAGGASLIKILQHQGTLAEKYRRDEQCFFPGDARFSPSLHNDQRTVQ